MSTESADPSATTDAGIEAIRAALARLGTVRLAPPLDEAALAGFERRNRVTLPEGYRRFLREIGSGGDGPGYGLRAFSPGAVVEGLDEPFPLTEVWVWDDDPKADDARIDACHRGSVKLGTEGCGMDWILIVSGDERGRVWNLEGQGAQPCAPSRDFLDWYLLWLRWMEAGGEAAETSWWDTVWADYARR